MSRKVFKVREEVFGAVIFHHFYYETLRENAHLMLKTYLETREMQVELPDLWVEPIQTMEVEQELMGWLTKLVDDHVLVGAHSIEGRIHLNNGERARGEDVIADAITEAVIFYVADIRTLVEEHHQNPTLDNYIRLISGMHFPPLPFILKSLSVALCEVGGYPEWYKLWP